MGSWKKHAELPADGLPDLLRQLADTLEKGALEKGAPEQDALASGESRGVLEDLPGQHWRKLVLVAERTDLGLDVRLKAKHAGELRVPTRARPMAAPDPKPSAPPAKDRAGGEAGRDKYRQLKKSLQAEYKAMQAAARQGELPGAGAVENFLALAEAMCAGGQPVRGAALAEMARANTAFLDDCQALRRAATARDAGVLAEVLERLARRKSACHAQFRT